MTKRSASLGGIFAANTRTAATRVGDMTYVKHDQFIGRSLATYGEWAQKEIDAILAFVSPGDFVIDLGANIGFHSLSFARRVGRSGLVWAFEPDPVNGLVLRHNILQAGLEDVVIPFDAAVSDKAGICRFRTVPISAPENFGHTGVDAVVGEYPRVCLPLDLLQFDRAPALIKLDIEGHELPALAGMRDLIEKHHPVLSIEADSPDEVKANGAVAAELGYDVYSLVVDAFNPRNFAENGKDIWNGHGRCANLLCVSPGKHRPPEGLDLLRRAETERRAITHLGETVGAAYSAVSIGDGSGNDIASSPELSATRADVRHFVSSFLKTTYGKLDPVADSALVEGALDFLSATGPAAEGRALRQLIIAGVQSFAEALGGRATADELDQARTERDGLRDEILVLQSELAEAAADKVVLADLASRLAETQTARERLEAELAHQAETARREVNEALARLSEAELQAERSHEELAALQEGNKELVDAVSRLETEHGKLSAELQAARPHEKLAALQEDNKELADAVSRLETEHGKLSAELSAAHDRLALQAQQLRHLRSANG